MGEKQAFVETVRVEGHRVACNGPGGASSHPRVWLELGDSGKAVCPYCGCQYVKHLLSGKN